MELPTLLGKGADLSRISDANLTVRKVQYTLLALKSYASCSVSASLTAWIYLEQTTQSHVGHAQLGTFKINGRYEYSLD